MNQPPAPPLPADVWTLKKWKSNAPAVKSLIAFLSTPQGKAFMAVLKQHFRPSPLQTPVVPGVDYTQVHAFRNAALEGCQSVIDMIELEMTQYAERKSIKPESGWAVSALIREPEKEVIPQPAAPAPAKKSRKSKS